MKQKYYAQQMEWVLGFMDRVLEEMSPINADIDVLLELLERPEFRDPLLAVDDKFNMALEKMLEARTALSNLILASRKVGAGVAQ